MPCIAWAYESFSGSGDPGPERSQIPLNDGQPIPIERNPPIPVQPGPRMQTAIATTAAADRDSARSHPFDTIISTAPLPGDQ